MAIESLNTDALNVQTLLQVVAEHVSHLYSADSVLQWLVLGIAIAVALYTRRRMLLRLNESGSASHGLRRMTYRALERILWPISMLIVLASGRFLIQLWQAETPILNILVPLTSSFAAIRLIVYFLRKSIKGGPLLKASESFIAGIIWVIVGLYLLNLLPQAVAALDAVGVNLGDFRLSILSGLKLFFLIIIALTIAGWISHLLEVRLAESKALNASARVGLIKTVKFALITVAVLVTLSSVGFDMSTFAVFGGALGVGLGFGLQRIAANFISGFIVIFDRSVKPGDIITIGEQFGWVQELRSRYIVLRNREGVDTLIPNENLITSEVINWSYSDTNTRIKIDVDISYDDDPEEAIRIMEECALVSDRVLKDPAPVARLMEFGDNGIGLQLRVWITDAVNGFEGVRSPIKIEIFKRFKEAGITIPFPQRDLHVKSMTPEFLESVERVLKRQATADKSE
ncbi:MAG: mechanosensitive ion channel [Aliidiomarina sp.]|uniref:mechanosensitive ion channel family protein n=1 Tax=Aliidiomarina sp. TaxID=1872439 RepID=UPI0025BD7B97|nr:mechanosensitive ion channel domain-containing protein [Aliidiomarina sp.]MCH8500918.1 mechanosensitive ion channel [Aliidiomarina sp.]